MMIGRIKGHLPCPNCDATCLPRVEFGDWARRRVVQCRNCGEVWIADIEPGECGEVWVVTVRRHAGEYPFDWRRS
jgi:uncharacterized Zn finger protein